MEIFYSDTRTVLINQNKVYKFFNSKAECESEVKRISMSPISEFHDKISYYKMKFVKILEKNEYFYSMDQAQGNSLNFNSNKKDFYLAGRWLRCFHDLSFNYKNNNAFLFGDFITSHLFIDHKNKAISTIDPGSDFGSIGKIETDIARFLVNLFYVKSLNFIKLNKIIDIFLEGYGKEKIDYINLKNFIKIRIFRNYNKTIKLRPGLKYYLIAFIYLIIANLKFFFIKKSLKN